MDDFSAGCTNMLRMPLLLCLLFAKRNQKLDERNDYMKVRWLWLDAVVDSLAL
jgi:hypothetical protein